MTSTDLVTIIAAVGLALTNVITAWRTSAKVDAIQVKAEKVAIKTGEQLAGIHELANSNLQTAKDEAKAIKDELKRANKRIAKLENLLQVGTKKQKDSMVSKITAKDSEG